MERIEKINAHEWKENYAPEIKSQAIAALEEGKILYFPELSFALSEKEKQFLSPNYVDSKVKNISFNLHKSSLRGAVCQDYDRMPLQKMLERFALHARKLILALLPQYEAALEVGRTSYRPVEVAGRISSYRKDDTRLHVDAFPASPNQGRRILRVFSNINPHQQDRVWRVGEPFAEVAKKFMPTLSKPWPGSAALLKLFNLTRSLRTQYDHYMLQLHNTMKADETYQKQAAQIEMRFPPATTWIVYTDCVSHAAMSGQFLLEQTFYLPPDAMVNKENAPLRILENLLGKKLA